VPPTGGAPQAEGREDVGRGAPDGRHGTRPYARPEVADARRAVGGPGPAARRHDLREGEPDQRDRCGSADGGAERETLTRAGPSRLRARGGEEPGRGPWFGAPRRPRSRPSLPGRLR